MPTHDQLIGELDLHLFAEGTHRRLWELLGPQSVGRTPDGVWATRFSVWAPNARAVAVVGDWNDWTPEPLERVEQDGPDRHLVGGVERSPPRALLQVRDHDIRRSHDPQGRPDGASDRAATERRKRGAELR